jgi:putative hydrolase of the HAD superfamily
LNPFLHSFSGLLLDLNGTFMFGEDRFGPTHDYYATYRAVGGTRLVEREVRLAVDTCFAELDRIYNDGAHHESFPSVAATLQSLPGTRHLPEDERSLLESVIASHEVGHIPPAYAEVLQELAQTHRLGMVSNIWSNKKLFVLELKRAGVLHLFSALIFSSEGPTIKPSRALFDQAVAALGLPSREIVVIGDSLRCDIGGASASGLASVWINSKRQTSPPEGATPDYTIGDLRELVTRAH